MADISFLLLVFFLVATTMNADKGIQRKLPRFETAPPFEHHKRNTLEIRINASNEIFCNGDYVEASDIRQRVMEFVNNNGSGNCTYCTEGFKDPTSSDYPDVAWIVLENNRETSYSSYVYIQGEITSAYNQLRNDLAHQKYGNSFIDLSEDQKKEIKDLYPIHLSESELGF